MHITTKPTIFTSASIASTESTINLELQTALSTEIFTESTTNYETTLEHEPDGELFTVYQKPENFQTHKQYNSETVTESKPEIARPCFFQKTDSNSCMIEASTEFVFINTFALALFLVTICFTGYYFLIRRPRSIQRSIERVKMFEMKMDMERHARSMKAGSITSETHRDSLRKDILMKNTDRKIRNDEVVGSLLNPRNSIPKNCIPKNTSQVSFNEKNSVYF